MDGLPDLFNRTNVQNGFKLAGEGGAGRIFEGSRGAHGNWGLGLISTQEGDFV